MFLIYIKTKHGLESKLIIGSALNHCYRCVLAQGWWLNWLSVCQVQLLTSLDGMPCHAMQPRATVTVTSASLGTIKSVCRCWWASSRCEDTAAGKPAEVLLTSKVFAKTAKQPWSAATERTQDRFCGSRIMIGCQSVRCSCWPHWMACRAMPCSPEQQWPWRQHHSGPSSPCVGADEHHHDAKTRQLGSRRRCCWPPKSLQRPRNSHGVLLQNWRKTDSVAQGLWLVVSLSGAVADLTGWHAVPCHAAPSNSDRDVSITRDHQVRV